MSYIRTDKRTKRQTDLSFVSVCLFVSQMEFDTRGPTSSQWEVADCSRSTGGPVSSWRYCRTDL